MRPQFVDSNCALSGGAQITIHDLADIFLIEIPMSATVQQLKQRIAARTGYPEPSMILIYGGDQLDDSQTLESYHVMEGLALILERRSISGQNTLEHQINISVTLPTGSVVKMSVPQSVRIDEVKKRLAANTGLNMRTLELYWNQLVIDAELTVGELGLDRQMLLATDMQPGGHSVSLNSI